MASTYYVTQSGAGGADGSSLENAWSAAAFNTAGNWSATPGTSGKISPGDTVWLDGTITTSLAPAGDGANGNLITIKFSPGAKLSKSAWGQTSSAGIYIANKDYLVIDGVSLAGLIESTDNGTGLGTQQQAHGIHITSGSSNITIKDLRIVDIYNPAGSIASPDQNEYGRAIYTDGVDVLTISGCTISGGGKIILINYRASATSYNIYNNTISDCVVGLTVGSAGSGVDESLNGCNIYGNTISIGENWSGSWTTTNPNDTWHHQDGIHVFAKQRAGTNVSNLKIYGNSIGNRNSVNHAGTSVATAWIYLEGNPGDILSPLVYNNELLIDSSSGYGPTNALVYMKQVTTAGIYNNVLYSAAASTRIGFYVLSGCSATTKNNILVNLGTGIYNEDTLTSDYNCFSGCTNIGRTGGANKSFAQWQAAGFDANGANSDPLFSNAVGGDFSLQPASPAKGTGADLSATFTTDFAGTTRTVPWDIGAYKYNAVVNPPAPATPTVPSRRSSRAGTLAATGAFGGGF
jgi:hypothetical protein